MERIATVLILLGLCGCALQVRSFDDPWRQRIRACGSAIDNVCGAGVVW
jgi:hypothetical protein